MTPRFEPPSVDSAGTTTLTARWVLPVSGPPIAHGWVEVHAGRIVAVGHGHARQPAHDLGRVALLPGLVNAHTHLELSWMAGRVPPADSFVGWVRALMALRLAAPPEEASARQAAILTAARSLRETGTVLVGDISNTLASLPALRAMGLSGVVFHEMVGFNVADPARIVRDAWSRLDAAGAVSLVNPGPGDIGGQVVAHAPYSVSPALFGEIAKHRRQGASSVHLAESAEEVEFVHDGTGAFRELLHRLQAWHDGWDAPRCGPVEYLARLGYLEEGVLAVHAVHARPDELETLRDAGAVVVTCPRSNTWVGAGLPRVAQFYASGVPVAIGTDSLASTATLNLFDELAELRRIAPGVAPAALLDSATRVGAEALGFGRHFGTIAPGRRAAFAVVDVPDTAGDVEEYLVSGVPSSDVRPLWL